MSDSKTPPSIIPFCPNRVWRTYTGGAVLDRLQGIHPPKDGHCPEDWIGSTTRAVNPVERPENEGLAIADLPEKPRFSELLKQFGETLLGKAHLQTYGPNPQVLVKLLDAAIRLHFQAHPTAQFARQHDLGPSGKAEAYYILEVRPEVTDPYIYLGFQRPPSKTELKEMIESQDIDSLKNCFDRIPVKPGDCLFIPGGRPHAIGPGILMVEIMEPSDLAVRFEFKRGNFTLPESARFMNRGLDFCLDVFDLNPLSVDQVKEKHFFTGKTIEHTDSYRLESLIDETTTPCYSVLRSTYSSKTTRDFDRPSIAICTKGTGTLNIDDSTIKLKPYTRFFIKADSQNCQIIPDSPNLQILECYPPKAKRLV